MDLETARKLDLLLHHIKEIGNGFVNPAAVLPKVDKDINEGMILLERLKQDGLLNEKLHIIKKHSYVSELKEKIKKEKEDNDDKDLARAANLISIRAFVVSVISALLSAVAVFISLKGC